MSQSKQAWVLALAMAGVGTDRPGDRLVVVSVFERDRKVLEYLDGAGIRPGVEVEVRAADAEIELRTGGHTVRLERGAAGKVRVGSAVGGAGLQPAGC